MCYLFGNYRKLEEFSVNLPVTIDLAERGVTLISQFGDEVEDDHQMQAMI